VGPQARHAQRSQTQHRRHPTGPDEVFRHRKVTTLVDRLIRKLETRRM
jgi:hypothetical protein